MKLKFKLFSTLPLFLLIAFPETSIQTGLALEKKSCHTIYLCKSLFGIGISDWIILVMTIILICNIFLNLGRIKLTRSSSFYKITIISLVYLLIGIIYNIFVYHDLIAYLYDFKVFLYFTVTYYWIKIFTKFEFSHKHLILIFILLALGSLWDYVYVSNFGSYERPNRISFIPNIMPLVGVNLIIMYLFCFKKYRIFMSLILLFEILILFNQASLGSIYSIGILLVFIFLYKVKLKENYHLFILIFSYLFLLLPFQLIIYEILPLITDLKSEGLEIRKIKTIVIFENYLMNIPFIIGKGLGSTYFETVTSDLTNVFSTGIYHLEGNVKFVIHSPLVIFYKYGVIGFFIIVYILFKSSLKMFKFLNNKLAKFIALSYPIFIIGPIINPGILKSAILAAIFLYVSDQMIGNTKQKTLVKMNH